MADLTDKDNKETGVATNRELKKAKAANKTLKAVNKRTMNDRSCVKNRLSDLKSYHLYTTAELEGANTALL